MRRSTRVKKGFRFRISDEDLQINNRVCNVKSVKFHISYYGQEYEILTFEDAITEKEAIDHVENYLSHRITNEYYNRVKDDLYEEIKNYQLMCKGTLLASKNYLDEIKRLGRYHIELIIGS